VGDVVVALTFAWSMGTHDTSAFIGAMTGTGLARGNQTIRWPVVRGIVTGWAVGPTVRPESVRACVWSGRYLREELERMVEQEAD